jgi:hypothetical protein
MTFYCQQNFFVFCNFCKLQEKLDVLPQKAKRAKSGRQQSRCGFSRPEFDAVYCVVFIVFSPFSKTAEFYLVIPPIFFISHEIKAKIENSIHSRDVFFIVFAAQPVDICCNFSEYFRRVLYGSA